MRQNNTRKVALGGMLAAVAVIIMSLGGYIPVATYICPMLCCVTQFLVFRFCGRRIAWCWFVIVSFLSLILGPDKEAVVVFIALGCYPMLKPIFERSCVRLPLKLLFFNLAIFASYGVMIYLFGMNELAAENMEFGMIGLAVILILGNITFFLLDRLLSIVDSRMR